MGGFDPFTQNLTFLAADGKTRLSAPLPLVDEFNSETASICLNYGAQLGACTVMLAVLLLMTPSAKFRRPSNLLHLAALAICTVRMALLCAFFTSPFNGFYAYWAGDYSRVPRRWYDISLAGNTFSLLLVVAIEAALMHQAWTMVSLWRDVWKYAITLCSAAITLLTVGWRVAYTVDQNRAVLSLAMPDSVQWFTNWVLITNALSISWFCAIFNIKLVVHLLSNRGVLPSYRTMSPMEILIMTNGVLMIVPVVFAGLEWGQFPNFESASLTLTSVAIILPMGTLAAQRVAASPSYAYPSAGLGSGITPQRRTSDSAAPLKTSSIASSRATTATTTTTTTPCPVGAQTSVSVRCEAGGGGQHRVDPAILEMESWEHDEESGQVRVDRNIEQHEERF